MDIKEFAQKINGFEYPARELHHIQDEANDNGFLVLYGMSDDLLEMRGIIDDEMDAYDGLITRVGAARVRVEAVWSPKDKPSTSWEIKVNCPHEKFNILEDGEIYCIGAVVHKDHLN